MATPGAGPGPGSGPSPGLEAALQKLVLRRKKVLSAEEMELYELAQAAGGAMDPDVFKILVDLLKLNVAPLAVFQMLKSMCAGQRLASEPQDPAAVSLPTSNVPETREASFLFAKNCSPPARASFSSALRPAASPVLHHSPAAMHPPLSPGPPGSLRFSCCLFSPFAGCIYWFISGVVVLSCFHGNCCGPRKPEQLLAARAGSCWPSLPRSLETEDTISWFIKRQPAVPLTPQRLTLLGETCALQRCPCPRGEEAEGQGRCYRRPNSAWPGLGGAMASELGTSMLGDAVGWRGS
ncbi:mitotic-spindle organizing protein 2B isoform X1 [Myotis myotis]|uniref:mitotic-spindle organizing protein 2B isoform X1 n=1 Tax=Myotis myotis TaxID=51298 RepID=UPI00174A737C|nr:mitotic-spindle organizing protein 2B isoform X1 [Myotis myotis]